MNIDADCRAKQHLLVQGFTLYTCEAAVCTRLLAPAILDDPAHTWAVLFNSKSQYYTAQLRPDDGLLQAFSEAALRAATGAPQVLCSAQGETLLLPLEVTDVRSARVRIEAAVVMKLSPPAERLEVYPDELIEQEAKRRAKRRELTEERDQSQG